MLVHQVPYCAGADPGFLNLNLATVVQIDHFTHVFSEFSTQVLFGIEHHWKILGSFDLTLFKSLSFGVAWAKIIRGSLAAVQT